MRIMIRRLDDNNIQCARDYSDCRDAGEVAHFLAELKSIEAELLVLWREFSQDERAMQ